MPYDNYIQNIGGYTTIFDSYNGDLRLCINVSDDCGINTVEFGYKLDCDPWNYWVNYTTKNENVYCFNLTKSQWTKYLDDTINWGYKVLDNSGKIAVNYDVNYNSPIIVRDDDIEPPQFSQWQYKTIVPFNKSISVNVTITDYSGISSATLYYDYNNDGIAEGVVAPNIIGNRYYYEIPAPCESNDKEYCIEQGRARLYMQFWIIAEDADNDRANDSSSIKFNSIPIFIDPPDEDAPELGDIFYIASYSPSDTKIEVLEGRAINFYAYTNYPKEAGLSYRWVWDGIEISQNNYQYSYQTTHSSSGDHTMTVYISNDKQTISHTWKIKVVDKLCDYELAGNTQIKTSSSSSSYYTTKTTTKETTSTTTTMKTTTIKQSITSTTTIPTTTYQETQNITGRFVYGKYIASITLGFLSLLIISFLAMKFYDNPRKREEK
ncbi:MAG: hypothetical protein QW350_05450 [Candidatus Aenigmatarchaeota archaeon]